MNDLKNYSIESFWSHEVVAELQQLTAGRKSKHWYFFRKKVTELHSFEHHRIPLPHTYTHRS
jgi:hypothetical protein